MTRSIALALSLVLASPAHAAFGRVRHRVSALCNTLLGPVALSDVVTRTVPESAWSAPVTVAHVVRSGEADVAKFFADMTDARSQMTTEAIVKSPAIPKGMRGLPARKFRHTMYTYGYVWPGMAIQLPVVSILGIGTIPNGPWGWAIVVSAATVGAGLLDYPIRYLASTDLGYPKLLWASRKFRKGLAPSFVWQHRVRVIETVAKKVEHGEELTPEDLHDQNINEEAAGLWRLWSARARQPNFFVNLTVVGSRDANGSPTVEMEIELVPEIDPTAPGGIGP